MTEYEKQAVRSHVDHVVEKFRELFMLDGVTRYDILSVEPSMFSIMGLWFLMVKLTLLDGRNFRAAADFRMGLGGFRPEEEEYVKGLAIDELTALASRCSSNSQPTER